MELVRELPDSHHLASHPARAVGEVGMYGEEGDGEVHYDEAPPRLGADSSPPKHFSSHQSRHEGREACSSSPTPRLFLSFVRLFGPGLPLGYADLFTLSCWVSAGSCFINNSHSQSR